MKKYCSMFLLCMCMSNAEEFHVLNDTLYPSEIPVHTPVLTNPLELNHKGIKYFFSHIFCHPDYCSTVLPYSFDHVEQLIRYGHETEQPNTFFITIWRTFSTGIKSSVYISADALDRLLATFFSGLKPFPLGVKSKNKHKQEVAELLYNRFLNTFEVFKQDPEAFFDRLSDDIIKISVCNEGDLEELHHTFILFLELCINKLAWSPQDGIKTWHTVISIADYITHVLHECMCLPSYNSTDLHRSLISRYCFFLELMRSDLSVEFFVTLKQAVIDEQTLFLNEDKESGQTHRQRLLRFITTLEAQGRASEYGYVSLDTPPKRAEVEVIEIPVHKSLRKRNRKKRNRKKKLSSNTN